ncbi:sulfite oxidase [Salinispira pacifica]
MQKILRTMTENPFNAESDIATLRSWVTPNSRFFSRNQSQMFTDPVPIDDWELFIDGEVDHPLTLRYGDILNMPKVTVANTIECSGNGRSLLRKPARGNPWTIGGVGNAIWAGIWLGDLLRQAGLRPGARHIAFEGMVDPSGKARNSFVRSIPVEKALSSTLLAYEMNGEPLPPEHGYPLRGLPLGWTGANCVKWLTHISVLEQPYHGHFMDNVYRVFDEGQKPAEGVPVTAIPMKSLILQPEQGAELSAGPVVLLGSAYGGESDIAQVEVSFDGGSRWFQAEITGPTERWAWKQWRYVWTPNRPGEYRIMARAIDTDGRRQPMSASWNVLGYGNNGVEEHSISVRVHG